MAEPTFDLELGELDEELTQKNKVAERITTLSHKVKEASEERDAARTAEAEAKTQTEAANKERDFYASFSDATAQYPDANEYKDAIKDKVMAGYSVQDATVAVLAQEGKLGTAPAVQKTENVAGGSAVNTITTTSEKKVGDMTQEEKRAALIEAEARGDLGIS